MPQAAVQRGAQSGTYVYVVNDDSTVTVKTVKLGTVDGEQVGDLGPQGRRARVVVDGADKLKEGAKVTVIDRSAAAASVGRAAGAPGADVTPKASPPIRARRQGRRWHKGATGGGAVTPVQRRGSGPRRRPWPLEKSGRKAAPHTTCEVQRGTETQMNPSRIFILRPVATSLLMVAIMLAGMIAYKLLPQSALPQVDYPTIQVTTLYPGAGPEVMTSSITAPLERQFGQMPGLDQMYSQSSGGASVITLRFSLKLSLDVAEQEVQAAINAAANLLPADIPSPPVYSKVNPADAPILTVALTSDSLALTKVQDLADTRIAQKISQLTGVGLVTLSGGERPAVRIKASPKKLAALGLSLDDLRTAVSNGNTNQAKGSFDGPARASTIDANDQLKSAAEYRDLVIAYKNGAPVRISDVAETVDDAENTAAWRPGPPAAASSLRA